MAPGTRPGAWTDPRLIAILSGVLLAAALGRQWLPIGATAPTVQPVAQAPALPAPSAAPEPVAPTDPVVADVPEKAGDSAPQEVPVWTIAKTSTLRFHATWSGMSIDGGFNRFEGDIAFDPEQLDRSHVAICVDATSVFSGESQRDETLKSDDWFSTGSFADATFKADRFRKTAADRYLATGTLTIKSVTLPISLPFTLRIKGDKAVMQGSATVDRIAYKIGLGEFATTDEIPAAVRVDVRIDARRKPPQAKLRPTNQ